MVTRRFFALLVFSFLFAVPLAGAKSNPAPKLPVKVSPKLTLTPVARAGTSVRPSIGVAFSIPAGLPLGKACKGKVLLSAPIGKKTVKKGGKKRRVTIYAKKRAAIKQGLGGCTAAGALKLPVALVGKKVKFTASFKGSSSVKQFKKSARLVVSEPAVPVPVPEPPRIDPAKGAWTAIGKDSKNDWQQWTFSVNADGSVSGFNRLTLLNIGCPDYSGSFTIAPSAAPFDTPFSMTYVDTTASDRFQQDAQNITQTFKMHFESSTHATGSFQMTGAIEGPLSIAVTTTVYPGCDSGVIPLEFIYGAPS